MATNPGFFTINDTDKPASAFVVLGTPRGGTTMVSKMLIAAGIFMGERMPVTAEDPLFARILMELDPDVAAFRGLIARRQKEGRRWGFKAPFRHHWRLLQSIPDCRFVVVFRDAMAVASRANMATGIDLMTKLGATLAGQREITSFLAFTNRPAFVFSYEKMVTAPDPILSALAPFLGASQAETAAMKNVIDLDDPGYQAVG